MIKLPLQVCYLMDNMPYGNIIYAVGTHGYHWFPRYAHSLLDRPGSLSLECWDYLRYHNLTTY